MRFSDLRALKPGDTFYVYEGNHLPREYLIYSVLSIDNNRLTVKVECALVFSRRGFETNEKELYSDEYFERLGVDYMTSEGRVYGCS